MIQHTYSAVIIDVTKYQLKTKEEQIIKILQRKLNKQVYRSDKQIDYCYDFRIQVSEYEHDLFLKNQTRIRMDCKVIFKKEL